MRNSSRFQTDEIEVTRSEGTRTADGFEESGTKTILLSDGTAQQQGRAVRAATAYYDAGDILFYAEKDVRPVRPSDSVTITTEDRRTINGTVEETMLDDNSLLVSING